MKLIMNKELKLSAAALKAWPYWRYGYYGTDGCDWRQYATEKGPMSIPDYAEEAMPLTMKQAKAYHLD